jgi:hypothetical protein
MHRLAGNEMDPAIPNRYQKSELGFYIATNDQDILRQINNIMQRSGYFGLMDTAGRLHYVVDGRRGVPFASRRIIEATDRLLLDHQTITSPILSGLCLYVDPILTGHGIKPELKGYQYLRCLLLLAGLDETRLRPISKTLYPDVAKQYGVSINQVERDIRYALERTDLQRMGLTPTAAIVRLYHELVQAAEQAQTEPALLISDREKPFADLTKPEGHSAHEP